MALIKAIRAITQNRKGNTDLLGSGAGGGLEWDTTKLRKKQQQAWETIPPQPECHSLV